MNKYLYSDFKWDSVEAREWDHLLCNHITIKELREMINNKGFTIAKGSRLFILKRAYYLITHPEIHDIKDYQGSDYYKYKLKYL